MTNMKELTAKEEEIMKFFWDEGAMFVKDIVGKYDDPQPHFNTISTIVRGLEEKGFLSHKTYGKTYQYYPIISEQEMGAKTLKSIVRRYFKNSYLGVVSTLVKDENISTDELRELLREVEQSDYDNHQ